MKNILCIALVAILTHTTSYGINFSGSDDFNDNSKDLAKWGTDVVAGSGTLTETNQVLQYTASGSSGSEGSGRPWIANTGSFTSNWAVQIDVNMPTLALTAGQRYEFGLQVSNGDDSTDTFTLKLRVDATSGREFHSQLRVNGVAQTAVTSTTVSTSATVRIQYDAATTTLTAQFDANGAVGGYNFTNLDSRNITTAGWNMIASSVFDAAVLGTSQGNLAISSANNVFGDNFLAVPEPSTTALLLMMLPVSAVLSCVARRARTPKA
jgi:hypothetical protein